MNTKLTDVEISDKIEALDRELSHTTDCWERSYIEQEIEGLQDELHEGYREECIAMGEHNKRIIPSGGNDLCFNCGCKV